MIISLPEEVKAFLDSFEEGIHPERTFPPMRGAQSCHEIGSKDAPYMLHLVHLRDRKILMTICPDHHQALTRTRKRNDRFATLFTPQATGSLQNASQRSFVFTIEVTGNMLRSPLGLFYTCGHMRRIFSAAPYEGFRVSGVFMNGFSVNTSGPIGNHVHITIPNDQIPVSDANVGCKWPRQLSHLARPIPALSTCPLL